MRHSSGRRRSLLSAKRRFDGLQKSVMAIRAGGTTSVSTSARHAARGRRSQDLALDSVPALRTSAYTSARMEHSSRLAMHRAIIATLAALAAAACASAPSPKASSVRDGDPATVNRDCKLLGTVNGRSMFGGSDASRTDGAMADAREKAAAMGATDIVFL